jgi:hypothetical protein
MLGFVFCAAVENLARYELGTSCSGKGSTPRSRSEV